MYAVERVFHDPRQDQDVYHEVCGRTTSVTHGVWVLLHSSRLLISRRLPQPHPLFFRRTMSSVTVS